MSAIAAEAAASRTAATTSRDKLLSDPRSGAKPLGNSDPGHGQKSSPAPRPAPSSAEPRPSRPKPYTLDDSQRIEASKIPKKTSLQEAENYSAGRTKLRGRKKAEAERGGYTPPKPKGPGLGQTTRQFTAPEFRNYQGIILAEFVAAELLVAATPIAVRQNKPGLSPYMARDMTKMLSIGLLYFILELMAVGGRGTGRYGAWFGGLILLVVGLNEAANITKVLDIFGSSSSKAAPTAGESGATAGEGSGGKLG